LVNQYSIYHSRNGFSKDVDITQILSFVDIAIERNEPLGNDYDIDNLGQIRYSFEYAICHSILESTKNVLIGPLQRMINYEQNVLNSDLSIVTTNYDYIPEIVTKRNCIYGKDNQNIKFNHYVSYNGTNLFKLHGSTHWGYCSNCKELVLLEEKYSIDDYFRVEKFSNKTSSVGACSCGYYFRPLIITPTYLKNYQNYYLNQIWTQTFKILKNAERLIFVGYSLPDDDIEVLYLLKTAINKNCKIVVIEYDPKQNNYLENAIYKRYNKLLANKIEWHGCGLLEYADKYCI
jgi:NAD-dependent SIR2 family protein deacetylase